MRALQTGNYLEFKEDFERALSTVSPDKRRDFRLNVDITTPDDARSTGNVLIILGILKSKCGTYGSYFILQE